MTGWLQTWHHVPEESKLQTVNLPCAYIYHRGVGVGLHIRSCILLLVIYLRELSVTWDYVGFIHTFLILALDEGESSH
jgi:hypothetical protein